MALGTTGITTSSVGNTLGTSSRNIGALCTHTNINKWSFWKPISLSKNAGITEADLYSVDDGFTIPTYQNAPACYNATIAGNSDWIYNKPTGGVASPYRIGDFRNYDKDKTKWFTLAVEGDNEVELGGTLKFSFPTDISWLISNFSKWKSAFNSNGTPISGIFDVGMLLRSTSSSTTANNVYYYKIADWLDLDNDSDKQLSISFPTNEAQAVSAGNYYVVPCITTDTNHTAKTFYYATTSETYSSTWYSIPASPVSITVTKAGSGSLADLSVDVYSYDISQGSNFFNTINSIVLQINNSGSNSIQISRILCKMVDAVNTTSIYDNTYTVAVGTNNIELISAKSYPNGFTYESATGNPTLQVQLYISGTVKNYSFQLFEK